MYLGELLRLSLLDLTTASVLTWGGTLKPPASCLLYHPWQFQTKFNAEIGGVVGTILLCTVRVGEACLPMLTHCWVRAIRTSPPLHNPWWLAVFWFGLAAADESDDLSGVKEVFVRECGAETSHEVCVAWT